MNNNDTKDKPCPKCRNTELEWHRINIAGSDKSKNAINCYECKYGTNYYSTKEKALAAWNKLS